MKRIFIFTLIIMLLSLTACGGKTLGDNLSPPPNAAASEDALTSLRADMKPPVLAVASFGYPDLSDDFGIMDYLLDEFPQWMQSHDFIGNIPEERIIRATGDGYSGELVCIVPRDPAATVCVNVTHYMDTDPYEELNTEVLYRSEQGDPILLLSDSADFDVISVVVTDSDGRGVSWQPYWGDAVSTSDDGYEGHLVMDFSPRFEKTAYDRALESGWYQPDATFLKDHRWYSSYGYELQLRYDPGQVYDGQAYIRETGDNGRIELTYDGTWRYSEGFLHLQLTHLASGEKTIDHEFPVLADPYDGTWISIFRAADGVGLPHFKEFMENDDLASSGENAENAYDYALSQGWQMPTLQALMNTNWLSFNYAMDLADDGVPGDTNGLVTIYDVGLIGAYTESYRGSWSYTGGMLHLSLVPLFADGYQVDDVFPVLMQDGELWIGRNKNGIGLPHFYPDQLSDILEHPMG